MNTSSRTSSTSAAGRNTAHPLVIRDASKRYGDLWANDHITLDVPVGTIVGLLGPNGAGKTTLIRLCAGWMRPDTGSVTIDGHKQSLTDLRARARLGIVSRDAPLYKELTVKETLFLRATLYGLHGATRSKACSDAIAEYRLHEFARRRIAVLSTGMLQRVAIACAMLHNPAVLLLDEPTVGLDPEVRRHIWDCLKGLAQRGVAVLMTTHYFEEATRLCDTVHLLLNGKTVAAMSPAAMDGSALTLEREYLRAVGREANEKRAQAVME